jgi:hypothetical protein
MRKEGGLKMTEEQKSDRFDELMRLVDARLAQALRDDPKLRAKNDQMQYARTQAEKHPLGAFLIKQSVASLLDQACSDIVALLLTFRQAGATPEEIFAALTEWAGKTHTPMPTEDEAPTPAPRPIENTVTDLEPEDIFWMLHHGGPKH